MTSPDDNAPNLPSVSQIERERLKDLENVNGTGYGPRIKDGKRTDELVLIVHVETKKPVSELDSDEIVPKSVEGVPTDVQESGVPTFDDTPSEASEDSNGDGSGDGFEATPSGEGSPLREERIRVVPGGVSVGGLDTTSGSGSSLMLDASNNPVILTNNHVIARDDGTSPVGDPLVQPGPLYGGGDPDDTIGTVAEASGASTTGTNISDSAVISVSAESVSTANFGIPKAAGEWWSPLFTQRIYQISARTGIVSGNVTAVDVSATIGDGSGNTYDYTGLIACDPISKGGSSGCIVAHMDRQAGRVYPIGLHFAGGSRRSLEIPYSAIETTHGSITPSTAPRDDPTIPAGDPFFEVTPCQNTVGGKQSIIALVANTGGRNATRPVNFSYEGGTVIERKSVTLRKDQFKFVSFSTKTVPVGTHDVHFGTPNVDESWNLTVRDPSATWTTGGGIAETTADGVARTT